MSFSEIMRGVISDVAAARAEEQEKERIEAERRRAEAAIARTARALRQAQDRDGTAPMDPKLAKKLERIESEAEERSERLFKQLPPAILALRAPAGSADGLGAEIAARITAVEDRLRQIARDLELDAAVLPDVSSLVVERDALGRELEVLQQKHAKRRDIHYQQTLNRKRAALPDGQAFARSHAAKRLKPAAVKMLAAVEGLVAAISEYGDQCEVIVAADRLLKHGGEPGLSLHAYGFGSLSTDMSIKQLREALTTQLDHHARQMGGG